MEKNDAAEQFYHTYRSLIFRTAARLCRTQEDLDDLIQDSLLRFLQNLTYYTNRAPDETSALIVLTMQCQKVDTFRKLHPEKWADWEDEAIEVTSPFTTHRIWSISAASTNRSLWPAPCCPSCRCCFCICACSASSSRA